MKDLKNFGKENIFLPDATRGAVRYLTTKQLEETQTKGIVVNTLHLMISPGRKKSKSLEEFIAL
jgi:tRNA-guanine family transglycosylase